MEKSRAILVRRHLLGESSLILVWLTEDYGLLRTAARGARSARGSIAGRADLFFDCEVAWVRARSGDLHALRELEIRNARAGIGTSYPATLVASYFAALVEMVLEPEASVPEIHDLLGRALDWLAQSVPSARAVVRFEDRLAQSLGFAGANHAGAAALLDTFHRLPPMRAEVFRRIR